MGYETAGACNQGSLNPPDVPAGLFTVTVAGRADDSDEEECYIKYATELIDKYNVLGELAKSEYYSSLSLRAIVCGACFSSGHQAQLLTVMNAAAVCRWRALMPVCSASSDTKDAVVRMQGSRSQLSLSQIMKCGQMCLLALVAILLLSQGLVAQPNPPSRPTLFVIGFCGNAYDWLPLVNSLETSLPGSMFPNKAFYLVEYNSNTNAEPTFYQVSDQNGNPITPVVVPPPTKASNPRYFAIQFYDPWSNGTDADNVTRISVLNKAYELKKVIAEITKITGVTSVNIVAHSMGGLDARAYVENLASKGICYNYQDNTQDSTYGSHPEYSLNTCLPGDTGATYANDVANIITIDTPHSGSPLAKDNLPNQGLGQLGNLADPTSRCEAFDSTNKMELLQSSDGGLGLIEVLNYGTSVNFGVKPSMNSVPLHAIEDYFTDIPLDLSWTGLYGNSDDIVEEYSQFSPSLSDSETSATLQDTPFEYTSARTDINNNPDCWVTLPIISVNEPMLHNMKCLGELPEPQGEINGLLNIDNMLWITSWTGPTTTFSFNIPITINYSAVDLGSTTLSRVRLWRAPDNNGQPGPWAVLPTSADSGSTLSEGTFTDTPPAVGTYWYDADVLDGAGNEAREPLWFSVTVNAAGATPTISTFTATPSSINGGATITYAVTLSGAVPAGGASISFSSSAASVIPNATLPLLAGATSGQTTVFARNPSVATPVTITASYGSSTQPATVTVNPNLATTYSLTVNSTNPASGVGLAVSPADNSNLSSGTTSFVLSYNQNTQVSLTAPPTAGGGEFSSWSNCDLVLSNVCEVTLTATRAVTANYTVPASVDFGTVAIGQISTPTPVILTYTSSGTMSSAVGLTMGAAGLDFAVASTGTCNAGTHIVGNSCTLSATFAPRFAGLRSGAVVLKDSGGNILANAYVHGTGLGPQVSFLPGTQSTLHSGFGSPQGVAVDGSGNFYVADASNNAVYEIPAAGGYTSVKSLGGGFDNPLGIALDASGNVFVADYGNRAVKEIPLGCSTTGCVKTLGSGFSYLSGIAVDESGNVYVSTSLYSGGAYYDAVYEILAVGGYATVNNLNISGAGYLSGVAVDKSGNVYVADTYFPAVREFLAVGGYTVTNTWSAPSPFTSLAVDGSGNVFVGGDNQVNEFPAGCTAPYCMKYLGGGFVSPNGVAVDGRGNVFFSTGDQVNILDFADAPSVSFATPTSVGATDTADGPQTVTVQNIGNAPLTFQPFAPGNLLDAVLPSLHITDCTELSGLQLAPGENCTLGIEFQPALVGLVNGHVSVVDDTLNAASPNYATQTIALQGTGIALQSQTISFPNPGTQTYGVAPIMLTASATSGLPVSYAVTSGSATVSGSTLTITGAGSVTVQSSQAGSGAYSAATPVSVTFTVSKAALTVTANNASKVYGAANPALNYIITGYVNGDASTVVSGTASLTTTVSPAVGIYPITFSTQSLSAANYSFTYVSGTMTVTAAMLTVAPNNISRLYGVAYPPLAYELIGFVKGDTSTAVTGAASVTTTATAASGVGNYPITAASGTLAANNYTFTFVPGTLTISKALLTVTANNASKVYGAANPALTYTIAGLVNGDTSAVVAGSASLTTTATAASAVGSYPITFATESLAASNYSFTYVTGTLVVYNTSQPLVLWLSSGSAIAGGSGFTLTVNGANFTPSSLVLWNGSVRATTFVNSTQLTATVLTSDLAAEGTELVTVANPSPNATTSAAQPFVVMSATPVATISGASLAVAADSSGNHVLSLTGTDFVPGSTVQWNGSSLTTSYISPWQISATVTASESSALPATVTVNNPAGTSGGFKLP